ncbi:HEAT repeat domain-containing protein [Chitinophaga sp. 212800010-3]|uniref:HEAT repeat domain-containing protein n=1 Tax=unclassified Chitinophaga TaxID=2619133 RepID=UPI002DF6089A|nr:HEAT repeat domain-containing protein [Chitinophaga sp. 212800010-3]
MNANSSFSLWLEDLIYYFAYFPLIIQIAIIVSVFAIAGTVLAYGYLIIHRLRRNNQLRKEAPLREQVNNLLLEQVVFQSVNKPGEENTELANIFRSLPLNKDWARGVIISQLLEHRRSFTGDIATMLRSLYLELGLETNAVAGLRSLHRKKVIASLVELSGMGVLLEEAHILTLTQSTDKYIREMARCYMVQCSETNPFGFLDQVSTPMLSWEQFELFRIISLRKDITVPSFARWIDPAFHPSVIDLSIKLATYYQQPEAIPVMIRLLPTVSESLRASMINSLGKLVATDAEDVLVGMYQEQALPCRMEILKALGRIGTGRFLDFLEHELETSDEFLLIKNAARSIVAHHMLAAQRIKELQHQLTGARLLALQHSLNPLITY